MPPQGGTITAGSAGSASFAVTTTNVADNTAGSITWYTSSDATTTTSAPTGITASVTAVAAGTATVTMTSTSSAAAGRYYFKLTEGTAVSSVATLTVTSYSAVWAKSLTVGSESTFSGVTSDSSGNTYAVGYICGQESYDFGNSVTATGTSSSLGTVIVKYDSSGTAQWAKSLTAGSDTASFFGVTSDSSGNTYAVGYITGTGSYDFASGVTATGTCSGGNTVIVKYDSSGNAQWAKTLTAGPSATGEAQFYGVTIDSAGNSYAVGYIYGTGSYDFASGVTAKGTSRSDNPVIVKYDSSGNAQWAKTLTVGSGDACFSGVTIDSSGDTYAVGYIYDTGSHGFGNNVTATGTSSNTNTVIVKYDSSGNAQWAKTLTAGTGATSFSGVTIDSSGNTYAVGYISGSDTYGFGNNVTATGTSSNTNTVIVKYDSSGNAQWAKTLTAGTGATSFSGVTIDSSGNAYAVGFLSGTGSFGFGNSVTAAGASSKTSPVIVKYDSSGNAQVAKTLTEGTGDAQFTGVTSDNLGNSYAVGGIYGTGNYAFDTRASAKISGTYADGYNPVIVRYRANSS